MIAKEMEMGQKWLIKNLRSIEHSGRQIEALIAKEVGIGQKWLTKISEASNISVEKSEFDS